VVSRLLKTVFGSPKERPNRALSVAALDRAAAATCRAGSTTRRNCCSSTHYP
jgi:hypothetical protein